MNMVDEFEWRVQGIPCLVRVTYHYRQSPVTVDRRKAQLPEDLYGLEDVRFEILDRKGYTAEWLNEKMTTREEDRIKEEIIRRAAEWEEERYGY